MNWLNFARLLRTIYSKAPPNLDFIQRQGLLAVKIGQTYALRADFLNEATCRDLAQLYRRTQAMTPDDFRQLLGSHVSQAWFESFSSFDDAPLACASIGQVHRGTLKDGQPVVVKCIRSNFRDSFKHDVTSLRRLLNLTLLVYPKLQRVADPLGVLENIEANTLSELDLLNEIQGQETLREIQTKNADSTHLDRLRFPKIFRELSSQNVMVSEFIRGKTLDELLETGSLEYEALLDLFMIHGYYMFCVGTFHGDLHPGNIIVADDALYFLDTGAVSQVGSGMRRGLYAFFEALTAYDYGACADAIHQMALKPLLPPGFKRFRERFLVLYEDFRGKSVREVSLTKKMMETIKLAVNHGMEFERGMYPIIKSLMYLDGMVLRCNPNAKLIDDLKRFIGVFRHGVYAELT